mgnify:CR=1 FL=1
MKNIVSILAITLTANSAIARDYISIAGSSTVLPFATIIAEQLGNNPSYKTPVVESGGSSVGKKGVCEGIGTEYIDIGNASSRMKPGELDFCSSNGVAITEVKVGYDGIVVANSKDGVPLIISKADLGRALTAKIPQEDGTWIDNPYMKWSDINPDLPDLPIRVMGPPTTSGTRASFVEMVNEKGYCGKDPIAKAALKAAGEKAKVCRAMRTDGAFIEAGEQDNLIVQKLKDDPTSYGIFGFSYLDQNSDTLQGAVVDGTEPTFENIANGNYAVSRDLFFYVKHAHIGVIPGVQEYMKEWTKHWGEDGILADAGMIPMPEEERMEMIKRIETLQVLTEEDLK